MQVIRDKLASLTPEEVHVQRDLIKALATHTLTELFDKPLHGRDSSINDLPRFSAAELALSTWKDLALRCFRSDKLYVRRLGLEQMHQLSFGACLGREELQLGLGLGLGLV